MVAFAFTIAARTLQAANTGDWLQIPDASTNGLDVKVTDPKILADDFLCTSTGPITAVHIWGSWRYDFVTQPCFCLGIWSDIPRQGTNYSRPGQLLCNQCFNPGSYTNFPYVSGVNELFFDPNIPGIIGSDTVIWEYDFNLTNSCIQTNGNVYWLSVQADCFDTNQFLFGWKTCPTNWNDDAVFGNSFGFNGPPAFWQDLRRPPFYTNSLDLAFQIITTPANPPTPVDTNKWLQIPDTSTNGLDVKATLPKILADDFLCTATGPITTVHIWGSWRYDQFPTQVPCFCLGLWSDIPRQGTNFSRPGGQICNWCFNSGQYTNFLYSSGTNELFFDPNIPGIIGSDTMIWEYVFSIPTNSQCWQTNGNIYWLSLQAYCFDTNQFLFGWKTCPTNFNDDAVFGDSLGFNSPPTFWQDLRRPPFYTNSLDLAFRIITGTNPPCPPIAIACPVDKTVECGTSWSFDVPIVTDICCSNNHTFYYTAVTNFFFCSQVITFTWTVTNCAGSTAFCTQNVTGVDTTPPVITCSSNKTVTAGTSWTFDPPSAFDSCCGPNVTVSTLTTITNGTGCTQTVARVWQAKDCCTNYSAMCTQVVSIVCQSNNVADKWLQIPDTSTNGIDVRATDPKILADDFRCNATGPITQVRIWGSWRNDLVTVPCFCLGLWTDVPRNGTNYSHPGQQICNFCYFPGQYTNFPYTNGVFERFWDPNIPGTNGYIGTDTVIWEYIFNIPTNACFQTNGNIYWLSVEADCMDTNQFLFGWKTCPTNFNDDAVYGHVSGFNNPLLDWRELRRVGTTNSLDLAFEIVTQTNPCPPIAIACPVDMTVQCGSNWTNNPPVVLDSCCGTNYTLTNTAVTNGICPKVISYIWNVFDCNSSTASCTQKVTVVDTTPPVLICPSNMVVTTCNSNAQVFWSSIAADACGSVTVTSSPPSGTFFLANTTNTVVVEARDACSNVTMCSFTVAVSRPAMGPLHIKWFGNLLFINWLDPALLLQSATNLFGPWTDVSSGTSSSYTAPATNSVRFYRLRCNSP